MSFIDFDSPKKPKGFIDFSQPIEPKAAPQSRNAFAVANDTIIEFANAAASVVGAIGDFVSPGNRVSESIKEFTQYGEEKQSDIVKAGKQSFRSNLEESNGISDDLSAVWSYLKENPLQAAAQAGGSFAGPGLITSGTRLALGAAGATAKVATNTARVAGVVTGGAAGGGDAAGDAYSLVSQTPDNILLKNKEVAELYANGMSMEDIRHKVATTAARQASILPALAGGLSGAFGAEKLLAGSAAKRGIGAALKVGGVEGAGEAFEEGLAQFEGQRAAQEYDPSIVPTKNVMAMAAMGGIMGFGTGAGIHAATNKPEEKIEPPKNIMDQTDIDSVINAAENSINQAPIQQRESTPIDDPMRLEVINQLPESVRDTAIRAYNLIIDDATPKGLKKFNQRLLDDILEQAASEMQATTAPIVESTIEPPKELEPFEQIKQLQSKVSDLEANNPFEQDHMDSIAELEAAVANFTLSKIESGEMPVFSNNGIVTVVTPSAKQEGLFQVTRYNKNGIFGDTEYASIAEAVDKEGLAYIAPLGNDEANTVLTKVLDAESSFQSRLAEQKQVESNRVLADIETTDNRVAFEQEKSRVNQRNAIIDSILSSDAAVGMRPAQIADMVKVSMAEQGYANPVLNDSEFARIKRFNDIAKAEPVAETIDESNLEGQAPSSNLSELVPERKIDSSKSNVIATALPADLISAAQESETNKDFWKALTARKVPLGAERNALMAAYKELKKNIEAAPSNPTVTNEAEIAKTVAPESKQEVAPTAIPATVTGVTPTEITKSAIQNSASSVTATEIPNSASTISTTAIPKTEIASSATSIAPTTIPASASSVAPTAIPETTMRDNGTLSIKGETKALQTQLKEAGIPSIPSNDGVTVGAKNVEKAQAFIASMETSSDDNSSTPKIEVYEGKGLIKGKYMASIDGDTVPNGPFNTQIEAQDAATNWIASKEKASQANKLERELKDSYITALRNGESLNSKQIESLNLRDGYSDMRWFIGAAADLFQVPSRQIRPYVNEIIKKSYNDMGTERELVPTNTALKAIAQSLNLSNPAQPTAQKNGLTVPYKKGKTGAETARNKLAYENPFLSFLATHGVSIQDRADVGGEKGRAKLIPGHGPLFRKNGIRLDELAQLALEKGFITQAQMDSETDNGGVNALSEMIGKALRNEVVTGVKDVIANRDIDQELMQEASSIGIDIAGKNSDEVYDLVKEYYDEKAYQEAIDLLNELNEDAKISSQENNLRELDFAIEELNNADENDTRSESQTSSTATRGEGQATSSSQSTPETTTEQAQTSDAGGGNESFRLTGETAQEARDRIAQQEREAQARTEDEARLAAAERDSTVQREIDNRQDVLADSFSLTAQVNDQAQQKKNDDQTFQNQLAGQADIFSSNPNEAAKEQIQSSDLTPAEKLANIAAINRGDVSPDDVAQALGTEQTSDAKPNKIGDFGEKIGGAKKDVWSGFKDKMDTAKALDITSEPLSKSWPEPDYQALLDNGADSWAVGFMHSARDAVPRKPTKSYKLKAWADGVKILRNFAADIADGTISTEKVKAEMQRLAGFHSPFHWDELLTRIELYQAVGHSKSLADIRISSGEYNMLNGVLYNPAKLIWTVEKKAAATAFSNFPQQLAQGDTKQEAIDDFKEKFSKLETAKPASKEVSFDVYSTQGQAGFKVGKKVGRNFIELAGPFDTVKEAREYKSNNQDALLEKLEKTKEIPRERRDINNPRVGEDMRNGEDVTPEMFSDAFGFRGVEFGNYVEQGKRQSDLNEAYDALMDMAALLGVPPKSISLNGSLGLAFGARGTGGKLAAAAHYERDKIVINLTKKSGSGSLGHEWWHALDNYFSRLAKNPSDMMTDRTDVSLASRESKYIYRDEGVRKEMIDAFGSVMRSIRLTAIKARSSKLDAKRTKEYWTTDVEMSARAFESYLISKLQDNNASNDYLANIVDPDTWAAAEKLGFELDDSYPYPTAGEIPAIRAGFDKFFSVIESKETDKGVALYSKSNANETNTDNGLGDVKIVPAVIVEKNVKAILAEEGAVQVNVSGGNVDVLKQIAERFGKKIVFFRNVETDRPQNKGMGLSTGSTQSNADTNEGSDSAQGENGSDEITNGFVTPRQPKLVFLNIDGANPLTFILGHELGHSLKIDDPKLWAEMTVQLQPLVRKFGKYRADYGQGLAKDVDVLEELVSDVIGDNFLNNDFWQDMAKQSQSLFKRIADKAIALLNKSIRLMVGRDVSIFISDMEKARSIIAGTMAKYAEGAAKGRYESIVNGTAQRQTDTAEFKKWFGDSKVVDADGKPLVVYHGTSADFNEFSLSNGGAKGMTQGTGFYFASSGERASMYAGDSGSVMPVYLNANNPFQWGAENLNLDALISGVMPDSIKALVRREAGIPFVKNDAAYPDEKIARIFSDAVTTVLQKKGFDSIIANRGLGSKTFIVFSPNQIKSATGNNGKFDGGNSDIRYSKSKTGAANPHSWDSPEQTKFDDLLYKFQDKHIDTKRVIDAIDKNISDDLNVYEKEEAFHNRAASRTKEFINKEQRPLLDAMRELDIDMPTLEEYLHARTAEETNILIAWRNRDTGILQDGGSGMKTADARKYLSSLAPAQRKNLEAIAAKVDAIVEGTRQMYVDYGLESKSTVDGWRDMFDHYVPLMREQDSDVQGMGAGQGFSVKGKEVKGRTGSTRKVVDIFANIAMQREKVIVRGEKNKVALSLLGLASANPNPEFWSVDKPETKRVYNPDTDSVVEQADPLFKSRANVIVAKVKDSKGKIEEKAVIFNEDNARAMRMSEALKNLDTVQMNGFMGGMAKITRYFSAINTQYNPIFGVVNFMRDFQGAMINLTSTPLSNHKAEVAKHTLSALKAIYLDERAGRKGKENNSEMAALWREFELEGGPTGYRDMFANSQDRADAIEKELNPTKWMDSPLGKVFTANGMLKVPMAQAQKQASGMFGVLNDYNNAMENAIRLAAYKVAKDKNFGNLSNQKAASLAKNLTVNFNRKGQVAQQVGALYAFFNASMQGSARLSKTLFTIENGDVNTIRLSSTGKKIVYGGVMLGVVQALMLSAAGFDDEEPPEFVRERSLIIPTGGKSYITVPMPLGLHVLPNLGRIPTEFALGGFKQPAKKLVHLMGLTVGAFNPTGGGASLLQAVSPTAIDPLAALSENKDWTGKPIAKESHNQALPGHALTKDTASYVSKVLSEGINYMSGGTQYTAGVLSPTPDQIDYIFGQVTGGVGREAIKAQQSISTVFTGEDLPINKIPLVGRFYGNTESQSSQANRFYTNLNLLNEHETEIKGMMKDRKGLEIARYMRENPEARMYEAANKVERDIQKLRQQKRDLLKADADPARIKMIDNQIKMRMTRFNETLDSVSK
jgi:hypothetical protein